jgi:predicted PurR-regulated permease PerM
VVRWLGKRGIPAGVSATGLMLLLLGTLVGLGQLLYQPAVEWLAEMPRNASQLSERMAELRGSVEDVVRASKQVEQMTEIEDGGEEAVVVREQAPSLLNVVLGRATAIVSMFFITLTLLYLLLANERSLMRGTVRALSRSRDRRRAVKISQGFQRDISYYLRTITLINVGLGVAVGLVLWWVGMPNPVLWGVMACVFNFVPYVGMAVGVLIVGFVAAVSFETTSLTRVLLAPASYAILSSLEGGLLTPAILGRRLLVNPPIILIWLVLWGWMWGVAGALLAVPMLMAVKIFCEHVPSFRGVALFLSRDSHPE